MSLTRQETSLIPLMDLTLLNQSDHGVYLRLALAHILLNNMLETEGSVPNK